MTDPIDSAQEREQLDRDLAIDAVKKGMRNGRDVCGCGAPISELRKNLGAQHCIECLSEIESEQAKARRRTCL